ncbi:glycosyltransferase [Paramicrobacterium fandaimingii]|uniref:glycosyltransferase n=1 Tax=Paramicrobacterium fandaimingii TaxID=2708079 RepID=UPI00142274FC|nr:glycosyltransferase [Microbacterium fandaimingii]
MSIAQVRFPRGRQFALTWGIPQHFGGMTAAMLHRSRAFVREGGVSLTVLTLDDRSDYPELEWKLRADGELSDEMQLLNIWDWFRENGVKPKTGNHRPAAPLEPRDDDDVHTRDGVVVCRRRSKDSGDLSVDRYRDDGSLLMTDREGDTKRSIVVYDDSGAPVRSWKSLWAVYRYWLDTLTEGKRSFLVIDSKTAARFVHSYRRDNVITMHLMHGSHRRADGSETLSASRRESFEHADQYDALVTLTQRQRDDLLTDGARPNTLFVIPNSRAHTPIVPATAHHRGRGVMLASLTKRKRVSHAVHAISMARKRGFDVSLEVYGDGPEKERLTSLIEQLSLEDAVTLRPFERNAAARFADADFSLLSSTAEGLPLVLVESMAYGCIPIAYDIRYGPADIIDEGRNGFLADDGDVESLVRSILREQTMPPEALVRMRRKAQLFSTRYSDPVVARRWARAMEVALEAKRTRHAGELPPLVRARKSVGRLKRRLERVTGLDR